MLHKFIFILTDFNIFWDPSALIAFILFIYLLFDGNPWLIDPQLTI